MASGHHVGVLHNLLSPPIGQLHWDLATRLTIYCYGWVVSVTTVPGYVFPGLLALEYSIVSLVGVHRATHPSLGCVCEGLHDAYRPFLGYKSLNHDVYLYLFLQMLCRSQQPLQAISVDLLFCGL